MKITFNRQEVKQIRELIKTIENIAGERTEEFLDNFKITKKAYLVSMITGELTFDIKEEFSVELLQLVNGLASESAPIFTAMVGLVKALAPTHMKYAERFDDLFNRYADPIEPIQQVKKDTAPSWDIKSVTVERYFNEEVADELGKEVI